MTFGALLWMLILAVSAGAFFLIAAIVAVKGFGDLRDLLRPSNARNDLNGSGPQ